MAFRQKTQLLRAVCILPSTQRAILVLCVLAYHLLVAIEKTLLDKGVHTSWGTVKEMLRTHQVTTVVLPTDDGSVLRIRKGSTPEPQHKEIYNLLEVPLEVMRPKKTWDDSKATT